VVVFLKISPKSIRHFQGSTFAASGKVKRIDVYFGATYQNGVFVTRQHWFFPAFPGRDAARRAASQSRGPPSRLDRPRFCGASSQTACCTAPGARN
jgi:hypothetical protein